MEVYGEKPRRYTVHPPKTEVKERIERRDRLVLRNRVKEEEYLDKRGVKRRDRNETVFAWPMNYTKTLNCDFG